MLTDVACTGILQSGAIMRHPSDRLLADKYELIYSSLSTFLKLILDLHIVHQRPWLL